MKSVISALLIFIFIVIQSVTSNIFVNESVDEMLQFVYRNEIYFSKSMWKEAENEIEKAEEVWVKNRPFLSAILNHTMLEEVDKSVAKLKNAVKMRKSDDFFYETDNVRLVLLNIKKQQKISAENIF